MNCCVFIAALVAATSVEVSITSGQKVSVVKYEDDCHLECWIAACSDRGQARSLNVEKAVRHDGEPGLPTHTLAISRHFVLCKKYFFINHRTIQKSWIFQIPIQTLIVVNEMVQSIANNLQMMGVRNRPDRVPVQKLEKHNRMLGGTA